jgi:Transglutaminase-like superfamily
MTAGPVWLAQLWLAVRLGVWLAALPIRLRRHTLPELLARLTPRYARTQRPGARERDMVVRVVVHLCRWRLFRGPLFPQTCLRQALALYHILSRLGYPVAIHIGVYKTGEALRGHSWVTVDGRPVAESTRTDLFHPIYSYPAVVSDPRTARQD